MAHRTGIEWTDATWNPVTGCTKVTRGCDHCYAATLAERRLRHVYLRRMPVVDTPPTEAIPSPSASGPNASTILFDGRNLGWSSSTRCRISFTRTCG